MPRDTTIAVVILNVSTRWGVLHADVKKVILGMAWIVSVSIHYE